MKKHILFLLSLVLFYATGNAQTGTLKGFVKDSATGVALESATVSLFKKDSSLINYQLTDGYGSFTLSKLPLVTDITLNVTYVGFGTYNKIIRLDSANYDIVVLLAPSFDDSTNVTVVSHIPIRMNGDTLEINPAAFKTGPNAVVEDLLTMVPGVTVWADGTITMNGKKIPSVLVDGKPFMGSDDARLATQNLPKDAIDKIQVYQEVDRTLPPEERPQKDSLLTMNIKLKENKQTGYFGKAGIGYGSTKRFESDLSFQTYNKKTSFGIGGGYNNINKNIGNLKEMFQNNTYRNYNPNLRNVGNFGADGVNKNHSIGGVYTHNFIETTNSRQNDRISINYTKSGIDRFLTNQGFQNLTTADNPQFIEDNSVTNSNEDNHDIGINYIKTNSYSDEFNISGNASFNNNHGNSVKKTEVRDSVRNMVSQNNVNSVDDKKSSSESLSASYANFSNTNPLARFNIRVDANNSNTESNRYVKSIFKSYINNDDDTTYNRNYQSSNANMSFSANVGYSGLRRLLFGRFNFFGIDIALDQRFSYNKSDRDDKVFDFDTISGKYISNQQLTNNNGNEKTEYTPSLRLSKFFYKMKGSGYSNMSGSFSVNEEFKQDNNSSSFAIRNLNRSFNFLTYNGNIYYSYNRQNNFSYNLNASYNKSYNYANVDQLYTITDDLDLFNVRVGNPYLKNTVNNRYNFNGRFNTQNPKSKYVFNGNFNASLTSTLNAVADSLINDPSGKRTYYYINAPESQSYNLSYGINIARTLQKSRLQLMYNGSYNNNANPNYIDNIYSETKTSGLNNNFTLQFALKSAVILNVGKTFNNYRTDQSGAGLKSFKNFSNVTKLGVTLNLPKSLTVSSTLDHTKNTNLDKPMVLWNAFAGCRFLKSEQGELKFSAMDILKEFKNIRNSADRFGTTTRISNGMQQYFMLTFSYYPRKFGKTEIKKKIVEEVW